jgi:hypothetical protein
MHDEPAVESLAISKLTSTPSDGVGTSEMPLTHRVGVLFGSIYRREYRVSRNGLALYSTLSCGGVMVFKITSCKKEEEEKTKGKKGEKEHWSKTLFQSLG